MPAKLYWFAVSHPSQAVRRMLDLKGIEYESAMVWPGNQKVHLRLAGFRGGTVPALKLDGRRVQGTREIARFLDEVEPRPALFPADPERRRTLDEVERWADEELQRVPRRIMRWGTTRSVALRRWMAEESGVPSPGLSARMTSPVARFYARDVAATEAAARRDVESLPGLLDRIDGMLADGTLSAESPDAATFEVLCTVRTLEAFEDLSQLVRSHRCWEAARKVFQEAFTPTRAPSFVPAEWLPRALREPAPRR